MASLREQTNAYDKVISGLQDKAISATKIEINKLLLNSKGMSEDELFDAVTKAILKTSSPFRISAANAVEDYLYVSEGKPIEAITQAGNYKDRVIRELEKYRKSLQDPDRRADFVKNASSISGDIVGLRANNHMLSAGKHLKRRFARVPIHDAKVCPFCVMLASRGFVYRSAVTAGEFNAYHAHCRCRVLPEDGALSVGYNVELFRDLYTLDSHLSYSKEDQERRKLMQQLIVLKHTDKDFANSVFGEFSYDKGIADFSEKPYERLEPHEKQTVDALQKMGYSPKTILESGQKGKKNIDSKMNGQYVEWKDTKALTRRSIEKSLKDANAKWKGKNTDEPISIVFTNFEADYITGTPLNSDAIIDELKNRYRYYNDLLFINQRNEVTYIKGTQKST